jgi:hypothetical protein
MMLIDASKLDYLKVSSRGLFKVGEKGVPEEYKAVTSPIKVKFEPDVLVLFYANIDEDGSNPNISYSILKSTRRKFKDEYVSDIVNKTCKYDGNRALLSFNKSF